MMKYASFFTVNSGVRTVPIASEMGISTSERLYFCALGSWAKEFGVNKNPLSIPAVMPINRHRDIHFMPHLRNVVSYTARQPASVWMFDPQYQAQDGRGKYLAMRHTPLPSGVKHALYKTRAIPEK